MKTTTIHKTLWFLLMVPVISPVALGQVPLTLRQVLGQVRTNNPVLRVERFKTRAMQANEITANLRPNPLLNNQTLFELNQTPVPGWPTDRTPGIQDRQRRQFWLQATKEFDIFNKRLARNRYAEAGTTQAVRNLAETERGLLFDAATRYVNAWYARVQVNLLQRARDNADTLTQLNRVRFRNLVINITDLTRTKLIADQYELQLNTARQELSNRLNELRFTIGSADSLTVDENDSTLDMATTDSFAGVPIDSMLRLAETNRADIRVAQATLETARSNLTLQQTLSRPRNEAGIIWNPQNTIPYGGAYMTFELPVYSRNQGGIQKAKVLQERAYLVEPLTRTRTQLEVSNALQILKSSRQSVDRFAIIRPDADRVLASGRYAYLRGASTLIDLLQAQRSWFDIQKGYYQAVYSYRLAYIRLLYTSGLISTYK